MAAVADFFHTPWERRRRRKKVAATIGALALSTMASLSLVGTTGSAAAEDLQGCSKVVVVGDANAKREQDLSLFSSGGAATYDAHPGSSISDLAERSYSGLDGACVIVEAGSRDLSKSDSDNKNSITGLYDTLRAAGAAKVVWVTPVIADSKAGNTLNPANFNAVLKNTLKGKPGAYVAGIQSLSVREDLFEPSGILMNNEGYRTREQAIIQAANSAMNQDAPNDSGDSGNSGGDTGNSGGGTSGGSGATGATSGGSGGAAPYTPQDSSNNVVSGASREEKDNAVNNNSVASEASEYSGVSLANEDGYYAPQSSSPSGVAQRISSSTSRTDMRNFLVAQRWRSPVVPNGSPSLDDPSSFMSPMSASIISGMLSMSASLVAALISVTDFAFGDFILSSFVDLADATFAFAFKGVDQNTGSGSLGLMISSLVTVSLVLAIVAVIRGGFRNTREIALGVVTRFVKFILGLGFFVIMALQSARNHSGTDFSDQQLENAINVMVNRSTGKNSLEDVGGKMRGLNSSGEHTMIVAQNAPGGGDDEPVPAFGNYDSDAAKYERDNNALTKEDVNTASSLFKKLTASGMSREEAMRRLYTLNGDGTTSLNRNIDTNGNVIDGLNADGSKSSWASNVIKSVSDSRDYTTGTKDITSPSSWAPMSFGWCLSAVYMLVSILVNGVATIAFTLFLSPLSRIVDFMFAGSQIGTNTVLSACDRYVDAMHLAFDYSAASRSAPAASRVAVAIDNLYFRVAGRAMGLVYGGATSSSFNSWCRAAEVKAGRPIGEIALLARGAGLYKEVFGSGNLLFSDPGVYANGRHNLFDAKASTSGGLPVFDGALITAGGAWRFPEAQASAQNYIGLSAGDVGSSEATYYFAACTWDPTMPHAHLNNEWKNVLAMGETGGPGKIKELKAAENTGDVVDGFDPGMLTDGPTGEQRFLTDEDCFNVTLVAHTSGEKGAGQTGFGSTSPWVMRWNYAPIIPSIMSQLKQTVVSGIKAPLGGLPIFGDYIVKDEKDKVQEYEQPLLKFSRSTDDYGINRAMEFWTVVNGDRPGGADMMAATVLIVTLCLVILLGAAAVVALSSRFMFILIVLILPALLLIQLVRLVFRVKGA